MEREQCADGELINYRSESLDQERHQAVLKYLSQDNDLFTQAESELHIKPLRGRQAVPKQAR